MSGSVLLSGIHKASLFILVPAAYLSIPFWRPGGAYGPSGRGWGDRELVVTGLMAMVFVLSVLSWKSCRKVAAFGLVACALWLCVEALPVLD